MCIYPRDVDTNIWEHKLNGKSLMTQNLEGKKFSYMSQPLWSPVSLKGQWDTEVCPAVLPACWNPWGCKSAAYKAERRITEQENQNLFLMVADSGLCFWTFSFTCTHLQCILRLDYFQYIIQKINLPLHLLQQKLTFSYLVTLL